MGLILGISGKARSGKDTFGGALKEAAVKYGLDVQLQSFASKLKDIAKRDFFLTEEQVNGLEKEVYLERWKTTPRAIMQNLGAGYRAIYENYWVDIVLDSFDMSSGKILVITDCRFKNEFIGIQLKSGMVVRMERDASLRGEVTNPLHPSETDLDHVSFERVIYNNSSILDLKKQAEQLLLDII